MHIKQQLLVTVSVWGVLTLFLALSNPDKLPVVAYIFPFVLLFLSLYSLWHLVRGLKERYFTEKSKRHRHLDIVVCLSSVLLLVLQSIGQLSLRDVVTLVAIIVIGYLYLGRASLDLLRRSSQHL